MGRAGYQEYVNQNDQMLEKNMKWLINGIDDAKIMGFYLTISYDRGQGVSKWV